jgi:hypothetical protein
MAQRHSVSILFEYSIMVASKFRHATAAPVRHSVVMNVNRLLELLQTDDDGEVPLAAALTLLAQAGLIALAPDDSTFELTVAGEHLLAQEEASRSKLH